MVKSKKNFDADPDDKKATPENFVIEKDGSITGDV